MKKNIIISMAIASIMVLNIGLSVFAEEVASVDETVEQTEVDTVINDLEAVSTDIQEELENESEAEINDNTETDETVISNTEVTEDATEDSTEDDTNSATEDIINSENSANEEITDDASLDDTEKTEEIIDDNAEQKQDKETQQQDKLDEKEKKIEAANRLREIKLLAKATKIESLTYVKELRTLFKDVDKADRQEVLSELAAIKEELKDYSVDTFVNGICIDFEKYDNVKPVIENGRTLAPVRAVTEALGATVAWDGETQKITITDDDIVIIMTIGSNIAYVNDVETQLDTAPEIRNDRTLVPVRFIAESFKLNVDWDEASNSIIIE